MTQASHHTPQPEEATEQVPPSAVSLVEAFWFWLKLGFISFGGPAGQIAILHQELVERRRWLSEQRFLHALNYCMLLPGPEAQQLVTYIGWLMHKRWGGVVAGALFVLPSLAILIALSWVYIAWGDVPWMAGLFFGIKPAVTAIVAQAAHRMGSRVLKNNTLCARCALSAHRRHCGCGGLRGWPRVATHLSNCRCAWRFLGHIWSRLD
jgi:chromate transporter